MEKARKGKPQMPIADNCESHRKNQDRKNCAAASRSGTSYGAYEQVRQDRLLYRLDRIVVGHLAQRGERCVLVLPRLISHLRPRRPQSGSVHDVKHQKESEKRLSEYEGQYHAGLHCRTAFKGLLRPTKSRTKHSCFLIRDDTGPNGRQDTSVGRSKSKARAAALAATCRNPTLSILGHDLEQALAEHLEQVGLGFLLREAGEGTALDQVPDRLDGQVAWTVLISPLCVTYRYGWASGQD